MILGSSLRHGGMYHFRVHKAKLEEFCGSDLAPLRIFLLETLKSCPTSYFEEGPRSSVLRIPIDSGRVPVKHEAQFFARIGLDSNYYDNAHLNVQMFMLGYDKKTIAIEVPLWLLPDEHERFFELFGSDLPLSGHIDLVRIEDGKIWIWDYKPNAHREKFADTQTYFYALMLSKRTGIPLSKFMCGYFDDKNAYVFEPAKIRI